MNEDPNTSPKNNHWDDLPKQVPEYLNFLKAHLTKNCQEYLEFTLPGSPMVNFKNIAPNIVRDFESLSVEQIKDDLNIVVLKTIFKFTFK